MSGQSKSIAVLGGGMLGQALALRLRSAGHNITVFEASQVVGGLAAAWHVGGVTCDKHYHVILPADTRLLELLDELDLHGEIEWARSQTGFFAGGEMSPLNSALDYLRLPTLGLLPKLRVAATLMFGARISNGAPLEQIPVSKWLTRWSGKQAFERLWRPLLTAKLGENYKIASAGFIWATIRRLYLARSSGAKTETLGYVGGGYARILAALKRRLDQVGVQMLTGTPVVRVSQGADGVVSLATADGRQRHFDKVVSTLPAGVTAQICEGLSDDIRTRLDGVVYQGILCATVVLDRGLSPYYLTYLTDPNMPFTAIVETSALTGTAQFGGKHVIYLPRYATQDDGYWALSDEEIRDDFLAGLRRVHPGFGEDQIVEFRLSRVRNVMAVPTLGYSAVVPPVETNLPGVFIASSAQITDGTLNVDATLGVVDAALAVILRDAQPSERRAAA
ncbi:MAG: FAD-dependent oxidoreductase [Pseudomonadota bacterium]